MTKAAYQGKTLFGAYGSRKMRVDHGWKTWQRSRGDGREGRQAQWQERSWGLTSWTARRKNREWTGNGTRFWKPTPSDILLEERSHDPNFPQTAPPTATKYSNAWDWAWGSGERHLLFKPPQSSWVSTEQREGNRSVKKEKLLLQLVLACGPSWTPFWPLLRRMAREGSRTLEKGIPGDRVSQEPSAQSVLSNSKRESLRLNAWRYKPNSTSAIRKWIEHILKQMKLWL